VAVTEIRKLTIWGNHSATQYPDIFHAEINGKNAAEIVNDEAWLADTFIPTVAKRGAAGSGLGAQMRPSCLTASRSPLSSSTVASILPRAKSPISRPSTIS
jgi:hypothetical protein